MISTTNTSKIYIYDMASLGPGELEQDIAENFPEHKIYEDKKLRFTSDLVRDLMLGTKTNTIRTYAGNVRIPSLDEDLALPVYETSPDNLQGEGVHIGYIVIPQIIIAKKSVFPEIISILNGYKDNKHMMSDLSKIYGTATHNTVYSAYILTQFIKKE